MALFLIHNDAGLAHQPQLLRHIGLGLGQQRLQVADAFAVAADGVKDAQALGVRQEFQPGANGFVIRFWHEVSHQIQCNKSYISNHAYDNPEQSVCQAQQWSTADTNASRVPQPLHVAQGRKTEESLVLPAEVGSVLVPHAVGGAGGVEILAQHQPARLLQPQLLLVLQGTQRRDGLEVVMETGDAHAQVACKLLDAQRPIIIAAETRSIALAMWAVWPSASARWRSRRTLFSRQEPVEDLTRDQRHEDSRCGRGVQEPDQAQDGVLQVHIQRADGDGPLVSLGNRQGAPGLCHDRAHLGRREVQAKTEIRPRR